MYFWGYPRNNGHAGTRNILAVIPLVFCANHVAIKIANSVRGAAVFPHPVGCGYPGPDQEITAHILRRIALHPNFGGVLFVGLGCERVRFEDMDPDRIGKEKIVDLISIQKEGDSSRAIAAGTILAQKMASAILEAKQSKCPLSMLTLGLKCGGTDAFSGIAANPVLGCASDRLVECGGTSILTEITELCGTEHIMARRAASKDVSEKIVFCVQKNMRRLQKLSDGLQIKNDRTCMLVSPGNADGGVSNVVEKALGGLKKAGDSLFQDVIDYGFPPPTHGLFLMDGPGHDGEAVTGLVAAGANIIAFTTGRGTPAGFPGVPVIKITGNPELYKSMRLNMDFDAGVIFTSDSTIKTTGDMLFNLMIATAGGKPTKSELLGHEELFCVSRFMTANVCC